MHNSFGSAVFWGGVQDEAASFCPVSGLFEGEGVQEEGQGVWGLLKGFLGGAIWLRMRKERPKSYVV